MVYVKSPNQCTKRIQRKYRSQEWKTVFEVIKGRKVTWRILCNIYDEKKPSTESTEQELLGMQGTCFEYEWKIIHENLSTDAI